MLGKKPKTKQVLLTSPLQVLIFERQPWLEMFGQTVLLQHVSTFGLENVVIIMASFPFSFLNFFQLGQVSLGVTRSLFWAKEKKGKITCDI